VVSSNSSRPSCEIMSSTGWQAITATLARRCALPLAGVLLAVAAGGCNTGLDLLPIEGKATNKPDNSAGGPQPVVSSPRASGIGSQNSPAATQPSAPTAQTQPQLQLPDDLQWTEADFVKARKHGHPHFPHAVNAKAAQTQDSDAAAKMWSSLLTTKPDEGSQSGSLDEAVKALLGALGGNTTDAARDLLREVVEGKIQNEVEDKALTDLALQAMVDNGRGKHSQTLLAVLTKPDQVRPQGTLTPDVLQQLAVEAIGRRELPELRVRVAQQVSTVKSEFSGRLLEMLTQSRSDNVLAQIELYTGSTNEELKNELAKSIATYGRYALNYVMGVPDEPSGAPAPPDATAQGPDATTTIRGFQGPGMGGKGGGMGGGMGGKGGGMGGSGMGGMGGKGGPGMGGMGGKGGPGMGGMGGKGGPGMGGMGGKGGPGMGGMGGKGGPGMGGPGGQGGPGMGGSGMGGPGGQGGPGMGGSGMGGPGGKGGPGMGGAGGKGGPGMGGAGGKGGPGMGGMQGGGKSPGGMQGGGMSPGGMSGGGGMSPGGMRGGGMSPGGMAGGGMSPGGMPGGGMRPGGGKTSGTGPSGVAGGGSPSTSGNGTTPFADAAQTQPIAQELTAEQIPDLLASLWSKSFVSALEPRMAQATMGDANLLRLGAVLPLSPVRRSFQNFVDRTWQRGASEFGTTAFQDAIRDPGLLLVLKTVPWTNRKQSASSGQADAADQWLNATEGVVRKMCARFRAAVKAETSAPPPLQLPKNAQLVGQYYFKLPDDLPDVARGLDVPSTTVHYLCLETSQPLTQAAAQVSSQVPARRQHSIDRGAGYWIENRQSKGGSLSSLDVMITLNRSGAGAVPAGFTSGGPPPARAPGKTAAQAEPLLVEILHVEIADYQVK
jgi:hypothetical protein